MISIGIAGYMGSGKSTCARHVSCYDGIVIEADSVAKKMMNTNSAIKKKITEAFGAGIISDNNIHFTILGGIVFRSLENILLLNRIVHPPLLDHLKKSFAELNGQLRILDAALISYWRIEEWFDILLWIHAPLEVRLKRLLEKSELSQDELIVRMNLQQELFSEPIGGKWKIISNAGSLKEFKEAIKKNVSLC